MNPFDAIGEHTNDLLAMSGREDGIAYNYNYDGDTGDWYNSNVENDYNEDDGTPVTIRVEKGQQKLTQGPAGQDLEGDVLIYVNPDDGKFTAGTQPKERATEVVDARDNARYRVEKIVDDHGGVLTLDASRMEPSA